MAVILSSFLRSKYILLVKLEFRLLIIYAFSEILPIFLEYFSLKLRSLSVTELLEFTKEPK